jgi:hypothetical protein
VGNHDGQALTWEMQGRLPVWHHRYARRPTPTPDEAHEIRGVVDEHGLVLLRGMELSGEGFLRWVAGVCPGWGKTRLAPGGNDMAGSRIDLHTEDAMLRVMPAWLWFYAAKPADRGGETALCDGAAVFSLLTKATQAYLTQDIMYWWRSSTASAATRTPVVSDPPGIERHYRGPVVTQGDGYVDITALAAPIITSMSNGRRVFANHILNAINDDDDGGPPELDGFHRVRTRVRESLPHPIIREVRNVTSALKFPVLLGEKEILWLDNTRFMHGREAFEGSRYIVVHKSYHPRQFGS